MSTADPLRSAHVPEGVHANLTGATAARSHDFAAYRELVEAHPDGLLITGAEGVILFANAAACRLFRKPAGELVNAKLSALIHRIDLAELTERLERLEEEPDGTLHCTLRVQQRGCTWVWMECSGCRLPVGAATGAVLALRDPGWRREQLESLTQLAYTDPVTGLANRTLFVQRLRHRLRLRELRLRPVGILAVDLDDFKQANDTFGHGVGDELLREFGARLKLCLREADTVARIGGDEFLVMLEEVLQPSDVVACAERLLRELASPVQVDGKEIPISASIGIVLGASSEITPEELLQRADVALYQAKTEGKGRWVIFDAPAQVERSARSALRSDLADAVRNNELCLHYQPEVELETGRVRSIEALLRWRHPQRGLIEANELLPLVRQSALGREIRRWVHREVCRQAQAWADMGVINTQLPVSMNLSAEELQCEEFPGELEQSLQETGISPAHVMLELPEAVLVEHSRLAFGRMHAFRRLGVWLAIDSFGARFGSLRLLQSLPIQLIKVDPLITRDAAGNGAILRAICSIAGDLQMEVTAKCIETSSQRAALLRACCTRAQGHLISLPLTREEATSLLQSQSGRVSALHPEPLYPAHASIGRRDTMPGLHSR